MDGIANRRIRPIGDVLMLGGVGTDRVVSKYSNMPDSQGFWSLADDPGLFSARAQLVGCRAMNSALHFVIAVVTGWVSRRQQAAIDYLIAENRILKEKLGKQRIRLTDAQRRRLAIKGRMVGRKELSKIAGIVSPDTILRWYRQLIARKYDGSAKRTMGRPRTSSDIEKLVLDMAAENPRWGYTTIRNALKNVGITISRSTVAKILADNGIEPAPQRRKRIPWKTFLAAHWDGLMAADFFTSEVLSTRGLVRYAIFFVMEVKTRRVHIAGITSAPNGLWMLQIARGLTGRLRRLSER